MIVALELLRFLVDELKGDFDTALKTVKKSINHVPSSEPHDFSLVNGKATAKQLFDGANLTLDSRQFAEILPRHAQLY
jgi:hypothetical protein